MFIPFHLDIVCRFRKDMALHRLTLSNADVVNSDPSKSKYKRLAQRLSEKVSRYDEEQDKMKYLKSVSHNIAREYCNIVLSVSCIFKIDKNIY
jgi:secreted Zn-dependent insulinase-like peptidase